MKTTPNPNFDPYQPLADQLESGDRINRWLLNGPRQKLVAMLKGQHVLDVGCGTGSLSAMLADAGCAVVGVDRSPTMLAHARGKGIRADFRDLDAALLPFAQEFDAAVISIALHEMPPGVREAVWASMCRAVRPGGRLAALDFAIPPRGNPLGRILAGLIEQDERGMTRVDPSHYQNFREFMSGGGLLAWARQRGQVVEREYRFMGGALALVVMRVGA